MKWTVNYDDPFMYHLYFATGHETPGAPGTLLTCFPAERGQDGRVGSTQPTATALSVSDESLDGWAARLTDHGIAVDWDRRFDERVLQFTDGEGQPLELVGEDAATHHDRAGESTIRGLHSVTLASTSPFQTASVLDALGFDLQSQEDDRVRYRIDGTRGAVVDILDTALPFGREGIGTAHHVAFRLPDEAALTAWRDLLIEDGLEPTRIKDRTYFHSVYVRDPGGILFELATDGPGLTVDESTERLGTTLQLPRWLEEDREMITAQLPPLGR